MQHRKEIVVLLWVLKIILVCSADLENPLEHAKSEKFSDPIKESPELRLESVVNEKYAKMLSGESVDDLEILNDSAEVDDSLGKWESNDFLLKCNSTESSLKSVKTEMNNVFKVRKPKSEKRASFKKAATGDKVFQELTHLFDHFYWRDFNSSSENALKCEDDMREYLMALRNGKKWAVQATDASGRYRGLFYFDNDYWLGSKQFCYEIKDSTIGIPQLQFFVIRMLLKLPRNSETNSAVRVLHVGQCLPKSCSIKDVAQMMENDPSYQNIKELTKEDKSSKFQIFDTRLVPGNFKFWKTPKFIIFSSLVISTAILAIFASFYESAVKRCKIEKDDKINGDESAMKMNAVNNNNNNDVVCDNESAVVKDKPNRNIGLASKVLLCFSFSANAKNILSTERTPDQTLNVIHGLRFGTTLWIILVHTYLQMFGIGENRSARKISERTFIYQIVGNATYSVDTFFFISGLLVVYLFQNAKSGNANRKNEEATGFWKKSSTQAAALIFYRFLRLTPVYIIIIIFTELSMGAIYNESVFTPELVDHINCNKYWWRNILYINNFYPLRNMCLMWSWYLANDFQFYVLSILLLILSSRFLRLSIASSGLLLLSSWIFTIFISLHYNYTHKVADPFESFDILYDKPWQRLGPYAMGMIAGYILQRFKKPPKISILMNVVLWVCSTSTLFAIIFGVVDGKLNQAFTSFYVSFGHTAWGASLIWLTLSCCWKSCCWAKQIESFLSFKGFIPLSRLSYCAYLIHPTVMMITSFQCDGPIHLKHGMIFTMFLGNAAVSFALAFLFSVTFEAPFIKLLKIAYRR